MNVQPGDRVYGRRTQLILEISVIVHVDLNIVHLIEDVKRLAVLWKNEGLALLIEHGPRV
jgi:hypothetical protein